MSMRAPAVRNLARGRGWQAAQNPCCLPDRLVRMRSARVAAVLDICCVLAFVIIGRASHVKGESLGGIASTSWPFLCGLGAGWLASRAWRRPLAVRPAGIAAWLCTVALGMILRVVSGQGTAVAFVIVALAFLGLFLLGWRLAAKLVARGHH
jgi:hypothetical protein